MLCDQMRQAASILATHWNRVSILCSGYIGFGPQSALLIAQTDEGWQSKPRVDTQKFFILEKSCVAWGSLPVSLTYPLRKI
jgi:hypothetical protein